MTAIDPTRQWQAKYEIKGDKGKAHHQTDLGVIEGKIVLDGLDH